MIIVPTRGRPQNLKRFLQACVDTKVVDKIFVIIDIDEVEQYNKVLLGNFTELNLNWIHTAVTNGICQKLNFAFMMNFDEPYYALMADDIVPKTMNWDKIMTRDLKKFAVTWGNDCIQKENLCTHPFVNGDLVRKVGWFCNPRVNHWFFDNSWMEIGRIIGAKYYPEVIFEHLHPINNTAPNDATYKRQTESAHDFQHFMYWQQNELNSILERIKQ